MSALAIVPAAGRSRRMGRPKLLLPFDERTVIGSLIAALRSGGVERVVLVAAPGDTDLRAWAASARVEVAVNPDPARGMLSSIWAGIEVAGGAASLAGRGSRVLVTPADLPALAPATVRAVLASLAAGEAPLVVPVHRGRRGHPLGIAPELLPRIERLPLSRGLRALLEEAPVAEVTVDDEGAVRDVDTPADYEELRRTATGYERPEARQRRR